MPSGRDSFRRNRVAPIGESILALLGSWRGEACCELRRCRQEEQKTSRLTPISVFLVQRRQDFVFFAGWDGVR
jgi:hypothetical protein